MDVFRLTKQKTPGILLTRVLLFSWLDAWLVHWYIFIVCLVDLVWLDGLSHCQGYIYRLLVDASFLLLPWPLLTTMSCTLPETNKSHLQISGWKTIFSFWVSAHFLGLLLLVSGSVSPFGSFNSTLGTRVTHLSGESPLALLLVGFAEGSASAGISQSSRAAWWFRKRNVKDGAPRKPQSIQQKNPLQQKRWVGWMLGSLRFLPWEGHGVFLLVVKNLGAPYDMNTWMQSSFESAQRSCPIDTCFNSCIFLGTFYCSIDTS